MQGSCSSRAFPKALIKSGTIREHLHSHWHYIIFFDKNQTFVRFFCVEKCKFIVNKDEKRALFAPVFDFFVFKRLFILQYNYRNNPG